MGIKWTYAYTKILLSVNVHRITFLHSEQSFCSSFDNQKTLARDSFMFAATVILHILDVQDGLTVFNSHNTV